MLATRTQPMVAIIIPSHNEPDEAIVRSICSAQNQEYDAFQVWVADDLNQASVRTLTESHGCHYASTNNRGRAKAGNLNDLLERLSGVKYIVVLDVGDLLYPNFLKETIALLEGDEELAFVQARSLPGNTDAIQESLGMRHDLPAGKLRRRLSEVLFGNRYQLCTGSAFIIRRSMLDQIGGFPWQSVADDYLLTLLVHEHGGQSVRSSEVLAQVPYAEGLWNFLMQQVRWMIGSMQVLSMLVLSKVTLRSRFTIARMTLTHFFESLNLISIALPLLFLLFGPHSDHVVWLSLLAATIVLTVGARVVCAISRRQTFWWLTVYSTLAAWPLAKGFLSFVSNRWGQKFRKTNKEKERSSERPNERILLGPLVTYLVAYVLSVTYFAWNFPGLLRGIGPYVVLLLLWVLYNLVAIVHSMLICGNASKAASAHTKF